MDPKFFSQKEEKNGKGQVHPLPSFVRRKSRPNTLPRSSPSRHACKSELSDDPCHLHCLESPNERSRKSFSGNPVQDSTRRDIPSFPLSCSRFYSSHPCFRLTRLNFPSFLLLLGHLHEDGGTSVMKESKRDASPNEGGRRGNRGGPTHAREANLLLFHSSTLQVVGMLDYTKWDLFYAEEIIRNGRFRFGPFLQPALHSDL